MTATYFDQLLAQTPTRVWVNNPTIEEMSLALAQGARGSTTNPGYGGNLLRRAPGEVLPVIEACVRESADDARAADLVQLRLVARIAAQFRTLFEASAGTAGFVSIQGAPEMDTDAGHIEQEAREGHALAPNVSPKIPATAAGLTAFDRLVADGFPTIVTEVFSVAQFVEASERYLAATARAGVRPPFFMSPITGIFGDHLKALARRDGFAARDSDMELAGVALTRECYRIARERAYPVTILAGGARIPLDLTGLVGGALHATINWSTFADVLASPEPLALGIEEPLDPAALARLADGFGDFRRAMAPDGLALEEYESFGPVQHFRGQFISGWTAVRAAVAAERARQKDGLASSIRDRR
ncbi:MAG: transaldolase family protein [Candidatus Limnocylindrales bacterium]